MNALQAVLGVRYHTNEYPALGSWWTVRLLELPMWQTLLFRGWVLPPGIATLLAVETDRAERDSRDLPQALVALRGMLPVQPPPLSGSLARNVAALSHQYGLTRVDQDLLAFRAIAQVYAPLFELVNANDEWTDSRLFGTLAHVLRFPYEHVRQALSPGAPLVDCGIAQRSDNMHDGFSRKLCVSREQLQRLLA